jgi:hypothetical protein
METDQFFEQHHGYTERIFLVSSALACMGPYLPSPKTASGFSLHLTFLRHAMSHDNKQEYRVHLPSTGWSRISGHVVRNVVPMTCHIVS